MKKRVSKQYRLSKSDIVRGLILAGLSPVFTVIIQSLEKKIWVFNWPDLAATAVSAMLGYLLKNYLEPTKTIIKA